MMQQTPHEPAQAPQSPSSESPKTTGATGGEAGGRFEKATAFWSDRQHRDLLFYLSVAIFFLELVIGAVAFFYGVIHATPGPNGGPPRFQFPWLAYAIAAVLVPAALLLIVHLASVGLFRSLRSHENEAAWQQNLPERLRKVYAIIQGAPTVVLLLGILLLGAALFYIDGAMSALLRVGTVLIEPHLPWLIGAIATIVCVGMVVRVWLNYRTKRLEEEFRFRIEVLERTGVIIVERGSIQLPTTTEPPRALTAGEPIDINPTLDMIPKIPPDTIQATVVDVVASSPPSRE